jgi:hypothetical protein
MKKVQSPLFIQSTQEDGVTVFRIEGLENHPKAFKYTYQRLLKQIEQNKMKILTSGQPLPVVRVYQSLEIH